jgi:hypothetical protein
MSAIKSLESAIVTKGWKKNGAMFFRQLDDDTLSHLNVFDKGANMVRAQMQTTKRRLNRASWAVYGLPPEFGTVKDHLTNACKCAISVSFTAREHDSANGDLDDLATAIVDECASHSERFRSVDHIIDQIADRTRSEPHIDRSIELICCYLAKGNRKDALQLVEEKKLAGFPGFELSFFGRAERYLRSLGV